MPIFVYVLPSAVSSPCAQGNSVPKRFLSLSRLSLGSGDIGGAPGRPNPPAGGCIASYSLAGISRWSAHTLVVPKTSFAGASFPSAAGQGVDRRPRRTEAAQAGAVAPERYGRLMAAPHGVGLVRAGSSSATGPLGPGLRLFLLRCG